MYLFSCVCVWERENINFMNQLPPRLQIENIFNLRAAVKIVTFFFFFFFLKIY